MILHFTYNSISSVPSAISIRAEGILGQLWAGDGKKQSSEDDRRHRQTVSRRSGPAKRKRFLQSFVPNHIVASVKVVTDFNERVASTTRFMCVRLRMVREYQDFRTSTGSGVHVGIQKNRSQCFAPP